LAGNASTLSLLLSATGIGALAGSLILARLGKIEEKGKLMFRTGYLWALSICLFSTAQTIETALILISLTGLFGAIIGSLNMGLTQLLVPDHIRGRVMSIMMMTHSFMPIGLIPISSIAESYGITLAIMLSGTLVGLSLLAIRLWLPELNSIKDNFDSQPASNLSTADKSNNF